MCAWILWAHWSGGLMKQQDGGLYNPRAFQVMNAFSTGHFSKPFCNK